MGMGMTKPAEVTKKEMKRKEEVTQLTHANVTLSSRETCWSLSTEQSWSSDKGCYRGSNREKVKWLSEMSVSNGGKIKSTKFQKLKVGRGSKRLREYQDINFEVWYSRYFWMASWFLGAVDKAAKCSPCPCLEGRWWHLSVESLSSHTGWPACLWWAGHYVSGPGRHCHQGGRHSSSLPPPLSDSHLPALEARASICHSTSQMEKRGRNLRVKNIL